MVLVVNGEGYDALVTSYNEGRIAGNSEINVGLIEQGFLNRAREAFFKISSRVQGSTYCGQNNLSCFFDDRGVLRSIDFKVEVDGEIEKSFGKWGLWRLINPTAEIIK